MIVFFKYHFLIYFLEFLFHKLLFLQIYCLLHVCLTSTIKKCNRANFSYCIDINIFTELELFLDKIFNLIIIIMKIKKQKTNVVIMCSIRNKVFVKRKKRISEVEFLLGTVEQHQTTEQIKCKAISSIVTLFPFIFYIFISIKKENLLAANTDLYRLRHVRNISRFS